MSAVHTPPDDVFAVARRAMVVSQLRPNAVTDPAVLAAFAEVPREAFVPADRRAAAYVDRAIPLGNGRALNPPLTTARLLDAAAIAPGDRVLVVGAATGYALALVGHMGASATGIETDSDLAKTARAILPGATLLSAFAGEGSWDAIVIDGAVEVVPDTLIAQLAPDGRLTGAVLESGVAQLALGRRGGAGFALVPFADAEAVVLPGFARERIFEF